MSLFGKPTGRPPSLPPLTPVQPADMQPEILVASQITLRAVRVDVIGLGHFTLSRAVSYRFAEQIRMAADALPPDDAPTAEVIVDVTDAAEEEARNG